jgi:hypothetical protein
MRQQRHNGLSMAHAGDSDGALAVLGNSDGPLTARLDFRELTVVGSLPNAMTIGTVDVARPNW